MAQFIVINRRGATKQYALHGKDDGYKSPVELSAAQYDWIKSSKLPDKDASGSIESNKCVQITNPRAPLYFYFSGASTCGPYTFRDGGIYVITMGSEPERICVDLRAAVDTAITGEDAVAARAKAQADASNEMLTIATIVFSGLATGFSAIGTGGAALAGTAQILSGIFSAAINSGPPPPSLVDVTTAMQKELAASEARKAAIALTLAANEVTKAAKLASAGAGGVMPQKVADHLEEFMNTTLKNLNQGSFLFSLHFLRDNPDGARFALSEFCAGIAIFALLTEAQLMTTYIPEREKAKQMRQNWSFPLSPMADYIGDLSKLREGLMSARNSFVEMRDGIVSKLGLDYAPEGAVVAKAFTKHWLGDEFAARSDKYGVGSEFIGELGRYPTTENDPIETTLQKLNNLIVAWDNDYNKLRGNLIKWPNSVLPLPT